VTRPTPTDRIDFAASLRALALVALVGWLPFAWSWRHELKLAAVRPAVADRSGPCGVALPPARDACARTDRASFVEVVASRR
jgi:hypothetical protein